MRVPASVPVDLALRITREAMTGVVPYRVVGKADVTATRSLKIESVGLWCLDSVGRLGLEPRTDGL